MTYRISRLLIAGLLFLPIQPIQAVTINDFSRLNETAIKDLFVPASYHELQSIVRYARNNNLKISLAGSKHSQGGHAFFQDAIVISLKKLNHIMHFDKKNMLLTIQTGTTWKEIQDYLHTHDCAVKTMQFANLFTIGGSLSVNCNGIDPSYGPLIESVQSIKIMMADGSIITASRAINPELFSLAIGGYGLFGIILEATIQVTEDTLYKREHKLMSLEQYVDEAKAIACDPKIGFHFAFLTLTMTRKQLFGNVAVFNFKKSESPRASNKKKRALFHENFVMFRKIGTLFWAKSQLFKSLHWIPEGIKHKWTVSRNNIMRPPASHLYIELKDSTNLLQEYFIPVDNLIPFIGELEAITRSLDINLMHVAFRFIPQNTESFLSYTKTDRIGIVLFFNQKLTHEDNQKTATWTKHLIKCAASLGGVHYLPIQLHASKDELVQAYPEIDDFFAFKKKYDPNELFMNHFYKKYANAEA